MSYRLIWADSLKGILIILVVLGHTLQAALGEACYNNHLWNIIYSFHMPAFMAISGFLSYRTNTDYSLRNCVVYIYKRFWQLIIPWILWSLLNMILLKEISYDNLVDIIVKPDRYYWFLWVLFCISVLFRLLQCLSYWWRVNENLLILCFAFLFLLLVVLTKISLFGLHFIAYYFLFYSFGFFLRKYPIFTRINSYYCIPLSVIWLILAWYWNMHHLPSWICINSEIVRGLSQYVYRGVSAMIPIYVLFVLAPRFLNYSTALNTIVKETGQISLGIYVVHILIIGYVSKFVNYFAGGSIVIVLVFMIVISLSFFLVKLLAVSHITSVFLLGRRRFNMV